MHRNQPTAFVFYHYFAPDDVISATLFGDLSSDLVESGWQVTAFPCVWGCRVTNPIRYSKREVLEGRCSPEIMAAAISPIIWCRPPAECVLDGDEMEFLGTSVPIYRRRFDSGNRSAAERSRGIGLEVLSP